MNTTPAARTDEARFVVVHESMFGNTRRVAEAVARGAAEAGLEVRLGSVTEIDPDDVEERALLVVAAPTHAFSLSRPSTRADAVRQGAPVLAADLGMREWMAALPEGHGRRAAVLDTRVRKVRRLPANAAHVAARSLRRKGYHLVVAPEGFLVEDTPGPLCAGEEERAVAWGRDLARSAVSATAR